MAARKAYGKGVRIGNWQEDRAAEEERVKQYLERKEAGTLSFMKTESIIGASTAAVELTSAAPGAVSIGDVVQLQHGASGLALSALFNEDMASVTASWSTEPSLRNTLTVVSMEGAAAGSPVRYGDKVALRCAAPGGEAMFLASDRAGPHSRVAHFSGEQMVYTQVVGQGESPPFTCAWVIDAHDASVRPESVGSVVTPGDSVLFRHSNSNECLACLHEQRKTYLTTFGAETEVTCSTKKAGVVMGEQAVNPENEWRFVAAQ